MQTPTGLYRCQCSPGWNGPTCGNLDNMCLYDPCPASRLCVDTSDRDRPGAFDCVCPSGYTGRVFVAGDKAVVVPSH